MTYTIELGRGDASYGNVIQQGAFQAFDNPGRSFPPIFDMEYELTHDEGVRAHVPSGLMDRLPSGVLDWLKLSGKPYRIEAVYACKDAPTSSLTAMIGGPCVTYGYVINVVLDDKDAALMFKLRFGGSL